MKRTIDFRVLLLGALILIIYACSCSNTHAARQKKEVPIKDTVINEQTYKLYVGAKGGRYIYATSSKTGKQYKRYFKKG